MDTLALYIYPKPRGTCFSKNDLSNREQVLKLFDYCQILEAVISKQGWEFLIAHYSYQQLFDINKESDWFDCLTLEEFIDYVNAEKQISPNQL